MTLESKLQFCQNFMVIIDTNCFFVKDEDTTAFPFTPSCKCKSFFDNKKGKLKIGTYCITESVKQEILQQKKEIIKGKKDKLLDVYKYFNINQEIEEKDLNEELDSYLKENFISVLPYPKNERLINIIERAVQKRPPFLTSKSASDKGFKDVLLWESILNYNYEQERIGKVFLLTKNSKDFNHKELSDEFIEYHPLIQFNILENWEDFENEEIKMLPEIIAQNNIPYDTVLNMLKDNNPEIISLENWKKKIDFVEDFIVKVVADARLSNGDIIEEQYYYDIQNNEPILDYQTADEVMIGDHIDDTME